MQTTSHHEQDLDLTELGDELAALRLCEAAALDAVKSSLQRHGQLDPLTVFVTEGHLEVIDGFKRLRAARALGWRTLRGRVVEIGRVEATILVLALHDRRGLTELEEAWLIRSLHRDHHLSQPTIATRLGRHKSWVFRRLMLVEALDSAVQADVRLGLLTPRAAVAVSQLPRGNQHDMANVVIRRGLTVRQTELWVSELLDLPDDAARTARLEQRLQGGAPPSQQTSSRRAKSPLDWIATDLRTVRQTAARLQARLHGGDLAGLELEARLLTEQSLVALVPVLDALQKTIAVVCSSTCALPTKDAA